MTVMDFPITSASDLASLFAEAANQGPDSVMPVLPVFGESAVVPGTKLRLPLSPERAAVPADERCTDCAGTGVSFYAYGPRPTFQLMVCPNCNFDYDYPFDAVDDPELNPVLRTIPYACDPS